MISIPTGIKISKAQQIFNAAFPFLKLEFFRQAHRPYAGNTRKDQITSGPVLDTPLKSRSNNELVITGDMTVKTVEQLFVDYFGLSAQVFRKSGNLWLETTFTDDWTLEKQNEQGEELNIFSA